MTCAVVVVELELFILEFGDAGFERRRDVMRTTDVPQVDTTKFLHKAIAVANLEGEVWQQGFPPDVEFFTGEFRVNDQG